MFKVKCSWDGLLGERNRYCVWSFWCSKFCSIDQTVNVGRGSVLDVRGPEWFCQSICPLWMSTVLGEWRGLCQWFAQQSGLPSVVFWGQICWLSWTRQSLMCRGRIRWWQSRTVSTAPVAGWTSSTSGSPEVHGHLHCFERVKFQVVKTAPDSQLLNLLSVSRLVTVLNEADQCGVICKLQKLDGGVFRCAVIRVQGEEQWGENTALRSSSADRAGAGWEFSQPHYLLPVCQEAGDPLEWKWRQRAMSVYSEGCPGWWC